MKGGGFIDFNKSITTYSNGDRESSASALLSSTIALKPSLKDTNPRNQNNPFIGFKITLSEKQQTRLSVDRAVDRPLPPVDRSVDRVPNRELGTFSRSTARSTDLFLRACCARLCTTVDRAGRPCACSCRRSTARSTVLLLEACSAAVLLLLISDSSSSLRRLPRRLPPPTMM